MLAFKFKNGDEKHGIMVFRNKSGKWRWEITKDEDDNAYISIAASVQTTFQTFEKAAADARRFIEGIDVEFDELAKETEE